MSSGLGDVMLSLNVELLNFEIKVIWEPQEVVSLYTWT